jgi:two-component system phosphate regulon sensor histidine kinase PhoR
MVAVTPLLAQLQLEFSQAAAQRDINLQIEQTETGLSVQANQTWVKQILVNLIENALKYTPLGGSIQISCLTVADEVQFTVYNTGEGISPLDAQRIFDRFYRIDKARSRKVGGTGLGLSIVKFVVEMFGGRIYAHSIKGKGVSFIFTLPASSAANKTLDGFVE